MYSHQKDDIMLHFTLSGWLSMFDIAIDMLTCNILSSLSADKYCVILIPTFGLSAWPKNFHCRPLPFTPILSVKCILVPG